MQPSQTYEYAGRCPACTPTHPLWIPCDEWHATYERVKAADLRAGRKGPLTPIKPPRKPDKGARPALGPNIPGLDEWLQKNVGVDLVTFNREVSRV